MSRKKIISVSLVIDHVDERIFAAIQFEFENFYWNEYGEMLLLSANILRHSLCYMISLFYYYDVHNGIFSFPDVLKGGIYIDGKEGEMQSISNI